MEIALGIIGGIALILLFYVIVTLDVREINYAHPLLLLVIILTLISLILSSTIANRNGYKQGQIDALNGEFKYEMKVEEKVDTTYTKK